MPMFTKNCMKDTSKLMVISQCKNTENKTTIFGNLFHLIQND